MGAAGSPELRTVDNAGYVDPGGRTRQVSQGSAAAPVGRGDGVAPTEHEQASGRPAPLPAPTVPTPAASATSELTERAARALCDRESYCGRVGAAKPFESADACMAAKRVRVHQALGDASCDEIRGDRFSACLSALRLTECGPSQKTLQTPAECTARALCGGLEGE